MRIICTRVNGEPQCSGCRDKELESKGSCSRCGQVRRLTRITGLAGLCEPCAGIKSEHVCHSCGAEDRIYKDGLCASCTVRDTLRPHIERATPELAAKLGPYLDSLIQTSHAWSTMTWVNRSPAYGVLLDILAGRRPLEHEALDTAPGGRAVNHLRAALVAHRALPPRNEPLFRFARWLEKQTENMPQTSDRQHLKSWAHWHILNNLNYRARQDKLTSRSVPTARGQVLQSIAFIEWLHGRGLELASCEQHDIDEFYAIGNTTRIQVSSFLTWSANNKLTGKITLPKRDRSPIHKCLSDDERRAFIDRLVNDSSLDIRDRVAGLLVLVYGQPLTRIARLRLNDVSISEQGVLLSVGDAPLAMIEPVASLLAQIVRKPGGGAVTAAKATHWLFPGSLVGQHIEGEHLRRRLRRLGIPSSQSRASALLALAQEVPAPILAETLGLSANTASEWAQAAGSDYARYAASRA